MGKHLERGYIALSRAIFEHPMFRGKPKWVVAWAWIISEAAWKTMGKRLSGGVTELERGQIAVTIRGLADAWGWSKSNVEYFLGRLEADKSITLKTIRTKNQTRNGVQSSYAATLLTICNYDKWQAKGKSHSERFGHKPKQESGQVPMGFLVKGDLVGMNHLNPYNHESRESGEEGLHKPNHLTTSANGKWLWVDYGTQEWMQYSDDYESVRGAVAFPEKRGAGSGLWFCKAGAALWPKSKRRKSA